jgi:hypothetical protein
MEPIQDQNAPLPPATEQPLVEKTFPALPASPPPAVSPSSSPTKPPYRWLKPVLICILSLVCLAGLLGGAYQLGYSRGQTAKTNSGAAAQAAASLDVPKGATIISQCSKGRGEQYVLPSNIPRGPVFNVYRGKVIGIEYMISPDDLAGGNTFFNLPTFGQKFDHLDVGLLSQGHTGYPEPHYHVDLYAVSRAFSQSITCK